jgi:hypothetical protein
MRSMATGRQLAAEGGAMAVIIPRWEWRTFGAGRGIGLDGHVNTSYPRGLAALGSEPPLAGEG